jgi:hypothetical protein
MKVNDKLNIPREQGRRMMTLNTELFQEIVQDSLENLCCNISEATDWINSALEEEEIQYSRHQLNRFFHIGTGKSYARRTFDPEMMKALVRIGFWWNKSKNRPYKASELEEALFPPAPPVLTNYNQPQRNLLELAEIELLKERLSHLSPGGRTALLSSVAEIGDRLAVSSPSVVLSRTKEQEEVEVGDFNFDEFYRFKNWLEQSLNRLGRPAQPRTAAQENGYQGRIGENLNLVLEGDRGVSLTKDDYVASSFVLIKIKGWEDYSQPIFLDNKDPVIYKGDWTSVLLDLRRNSQPSTSR